MRELRSDWSVADNTLATGHTQGLPNKVTPAEHVVECRNSGWMAPAFLIRSCGAE